MDGKLNRHLNEIDDTAHEQVELLTRHMAAQEGVTEALKAQDPRAWVGAMNSIKNRAEEVVMHDLVYTE